MIEPYTGYCIETEVFQKWLNEFGSLKQDSRIYSSILKTE
jgi:hypothetical protein